MNRVYAKAILDIQLPANDADATTVRQYFARLAQEVWREGEGFSGKRPFGNSDWTGEVIEPLIDAGIASGSGEAYGVVAQVLDLLAAGEVQ